MKKKSKEAIEQDKFLAEFVIDARMQEIIRRAIDRYEGDSSVLQSAIGSLVFAKVFGWKGLRITMSGVTYKKYERILGESFRNVADDLTPMSRTIRGIRLAEKLGKFWQAIAGGQIRATEGKLLEKVA